MGVIFELISWFDDDDVSDNDITGIIDNGFCVDHDAYGEHIVHDLKPGGRDITVTEENKKEYVKYVSKCNVHFPTLNSLSMHHCLKFFKLLPRV